MFSRLAMGIAFHGLIFMMLFPQIVVAEKTNQSENWARQAEEVDRLVKKKEWEQARRALAQLANGFSSGNFTKSHLSVEGMKALSETLVDLDQELVRVKPRPKRLSYASERMLLAFDALAHDHQPLWHQYESLLKSDVLALKKYIKQDRPEAVRSKGRTLIQHFERIEPALYVSMDSETAGAVRNLLYSLEGEIRKGSLEMNQLSEGVELWERMLEPLFRQKEEELLALAHRNRPTWPEAALVLGGVIVAVLTYVGWKKYKYQQIRVYDRSYSRSNVNPSPKTSRTS
ncbi:sporulation protein YpjB [Melghirimyces algeriensis]|uniref:Sporulation protein YpjB n=1 Tax=Melghirimyces algeriensis TaxID=910412 RepID=A0A521B7W2_9BACL|nr:sporulation protein YpjB [Melghirimyces algeriensis]SMO43145.1 sporulation protein YpjB [Melghirimyces algeriensis]